MDGVRKLSAFTLTWELGAHKQRYRHVELYVAISQRWATSTRRAPSCSRLHTPKSSRNRCHVVSHLHVVCQVSCRLPRVVGCTMDAPLSNGYCGRKEHHQVFVASARSTDCVIVRMGRRSKLGKHQDVKRLVSTRVQRRYFFVPEPCNESHRNHDMIAHGPTQVQLWATAANTWISSWCPR